MNNNGKWVYADMNGKGWSETVFDDKESAIAEALKAFPYSSEIIVGQIIEYLGAGEYVESQETIKRGCLM